MKRLGFIVFLTIFTLIYTEFHYFLYGQVAKGLELTGRALTVTRTVLVGMGLLYYLMLFMRHRFPVTPVLYLGAIWFGSIAIGFSFFLVKAAVNLFLPQYTRELTIGTLALITLAVSFSLVNAACAPRFRKITVPLKKLPPALDGFTIIQLSDLHLGSLTTPANLEHLVQRCNDLKADLAVITGDIVDHHMELPNDFTRSLNKLNARYGILAVTGNHDFYSGVDGFMAFAKETGIKPLRNEHITVAGALEVAGVDDPTISRRTGQKPDLTDALKACDMTRPVLLLAHQPDDFDKAADLGVDLQLSGHTHAGQFPPMDLIVRLYYQYPWGLYRKGSSFIYTTCGTNTWGPPMRLTSRSEFILITLKAGDN